MNYKTLLIEISTEEMPAKKIRNIAKNFYQNILFQLNKYKIKFFKIHLFDSPRRIAVVIKQLCTDNIVKKNVIKGPATKYHIDDQGKLTLATLKWLKKFNINIQQTKIIKNKKGEWLFYEHIENITDIRTILKKIIIFAIENLSIQNTIQWNEHKITFIRPIRNILILLNNKTIILKKFGFSKQQYLYGNISTMPNKIIIKHAIEYEYLLYKFGKVIAKFDLRKKKIKYQIQKIANLVSGITNISDTMLEETACLVEWPKALLGQFKKEFLKIPKDILIYLVECVQKHFVLYKKCNNQLQKHFIIIANLDSKNPIKIIKGNESVLHSKLCDVNFFIKKDLNNTIEEYVEKLKTITFHEKLGTMWDKTHRLIQLMKYISKYINIDCKNGIRAAYLSKFDLKTLLVYEFPELRGIVGMNYALYYKEPIKVALALKEQYYPKFSGDKLPESKIGCMLSIIDQIDTIVGQFIIGNMPIKDKDPFGLRRIAIGILRIIIEKNFDMDVKSIIQQAILFYKGNNNTIICNNILNFIINRLYVWYQEKKYNIHIIKSIFSKHNYNIFDMNARLILLSKFQKTESFKKIIITYKRIINLIKDMNIDYDNKNIVKSTHIQHEKEKILCLQINNIYTILDNIVQQKKYDDLLNLLLKLNIPINDFLNHVPIKYTSETIKIYRIEILIKIKKLFLIIADFRKI